MKTVTDTFAAAVRGSHQMVARVRVVAPGQSGTNPDGRVLGIEDGTVTLDATAQVRGTLDFTTPGAGWDPRAGRSDLLPYGSELFVERGIRIATGKLEYVPLGYFRIWEVDQENVPNGDLRITAQDRMSAIIDARFTAPRQYPASAIAGTVVTDLVTEVLPQVVVDWQAVNGPLGRSVVSEDDRYAFLNDIVTSLGAVWYFGEDGHLVVKPAPDPTEPVYVVNGGRAGVLSTAARSVSREGVYNAVVATGEAADDTPPVTAIAYDNSPDSPTYWGGAFGQVPEFYSSPLLTTVDGARSAAETLLAQAIGLPYNLNFGMVPDPALEPLDVVRLIYPGFAEVHVLDQVAIPLTAAGTMTATTRQVTNVRIEVV